MNVNENQRKLTEMNAKSMRRGGAEELKCPGQYPPVPERYENN